VTEVTVTRSSLTTAIAGTLTVGVIALLVLVGSSSGGDTSSAHAGTGNPRVELQFPAVARLLEAGPLVVSGVFLLLLLLAFGVFFIIGRRAARPIEIARRKQLQFAVDASHELRTPLTIVEGEASLALMAKRSPEEYRLALTKILAEGRRMRLLVDDLMWLARAESAPAGAEFVSADLGEIAEAAARRFESVAAAKQQQIATRIEAGSHLNLTAPAEWIERLTGVLLDNACRYAPVGGQIRIGASTSRDTVSLTVEDSGAGIPEAEWDQVFDRFHRATAVAGGVGLGLAIGARVVSETHGTWTVGRSELGGALLQARWRRSRA
jgi:two-component system, OmpR family, sensor histidine kinase CiaH